MIALAACSGGGGSGTPNAGPSSGPGPVSTARQQGQLKIVFPAHRTSGVHRAFLSPSAATLVITITGAPTITADVSPTSQSCTPGVNGSRTCEIAIAAPAGSDTFTLTLSDASGVLLGQGSVTQSITGPNFIVNVTVGGVIASIHIVASVQPFNVNVPSSIALEYAALDADLNTIIGPYSGTVTFTNSDTTGAFTLSPGAVTGSGTAVTLSYDGANVAGTTIGASAPGVSPGNVQSATFEVATPCTATTPNAQVAYLASSTTPTTVSLTPSTGGSFSLTIAPGALPDNTTLSLAELSQGNLPEPLSRLRPAFAAAALGDRRHPAFQQGAGNTYVYGFCANGGDHPLAAGAAVTIDASGFALSALGISAGETLNVALATDNSYLDVGTVLVGRDGASFRSVAPTTAFPGVIENGDYLIYAPPAATTPLAPSGGIAALADDGDGSSFSTGNGVQYIQYEDPSGTPLPVPESTFIPVPNEPNLAGLTLAADNLHGAVVDGADTIYTFSGTTTSSLGVAASFSISNGGGSPGLSGDTIAAYPDGNGAVVAGNGPQMLEVDGIASGSIGGSQPVSFSTCAGDLSAQNHRDGVVISSDGKVMLARGYGGLDVFAVNPSPPHDYCLTSSFLNNYADVAPSPAPSPAVLVPESTEGREGMAISPADSSRAVIVGADPASGDEPAAQLLTGLPNSAHLQSIVRLRLPAIGGARRAFRRPHASTRAPQETVFSAGDQPYAVAISTNGDYAFVQTAGGIVTLAGVESGTLAQVGSDYDPAISGLPNGVVCSLANQYSTLAVTPDGKYLLAVAPCAGNPTENGPGTGVLLTIPILRGGSLGAPVGQLDGVLSPTDDQLVVGAPVATPPP